MLKYKLNKNGIRHDFIYIWLDVTQGNFSQMLSGKRKFKPEQREQLEEYLKDIEAVNKNHGLL